MKKIALSFAVLLLSVTSLLEVSAQRREVQGAGQGRGILKYEGERDASLRDASVFLKRNGELEIRLNGIRTGDTYNFTGKWFEGRNNDYEFELTGGFGTSGAYGKGTVSLRPNGQINHLEFKGYSKRQQFSVTFDSDLAGNNNPPSNYDSRDSQYVGTYRSSERTQRYNQDFTIIRVLRIKDDGTVELASRFKGGQPVVNRESLTKHGNLLSDIRDRRRVLHTGTWRTTGRGGLEVSLTTLDPEDRNDSAPATLRLAFRGTDRDNLQTLIWDKQLYGNTAFQFARITGDDPEDTYQKPVDNDPRPADDRINLSADGEGSLSIGRSPKRSITRVTVIDSSFNRVEITLNQANGETTRFTGQVINTDNRVLTVQLSNSGAAKASGTLTIERGFGGRIRRLSGNGLLDTRSFTVDFNSSNDRNPGPEREDRDGINISQNGSGLYTRERFPNMAIESVSVITRTTGEADISLRYSSGQRTVFSGRVDTRNASGLVVRLTGSGNFTATGTINIEYGRNNSIESVNGDGRIDGSRFTIQFSKR
jgi:hypothetical protein